MARYRIGNDMTILWSITNKDGSPFPLAGKEVHLYYTCERGRYEAEIEIQDNVVSWEFLASRQKALGGYTLTLEVLQSDGKRALKRDLCDAFVLVGKNCEEKFDHDGAHIEEGGIVNLVTSLEVYRVSPIIPYVVRDENGIGYWYVDGVNTGDRSTGETAYEYAKSKGYEGTEDQFAEKLAEFPDWNIANASEGGYIKNRTHGVTYERASVEGTLKELGYIPNKYVSVLHYARTNGVLEGKGLYLGGLLYDPIVGEEYSVKYNGPSVFARVVEVEDGYDVQIKGESDTGYILKVAIVEYKRIDDAYIPDTILRVEDVDTALSTTSEKPVMNKVITEELNKSPFEKGSSDNSALLKGGDNIATSELSTTFGRRNQSLGKYSHSEGEFNIASGVRSHAEGCYTKAEGADSHAENEGSIARGINSHAEGYYTLASGITSHTEGASRANDPEYNPENPAFATVVKYLEARGQRSHAEGYATQAFGNQSHSEGIDTLAEGTNSHAEGQETKALKNNSHSEGNKTISNAADAHVEGYMSEANGWGSHAEGIGAETNNQGEHAEGRYNVSIKSSASDASVHTVGIGTSSTNRKNAHEIHYDGKHYIYGIGNYNGKNQATAKDLATVVNSLATKQDIANLVDSAPETLDTLNELAQAIKENDNVIEALDNAITNKADKSTIEELSEEVSKKPDTTGTYPSMHVGTADDLAGRGESVPASFGFRASGGKSIKDGRAYIKRIKGNSVVWNQKLRNSRIENADYWYSQRSNAEFNGQGVHIVATSEFSNLCQNARLILGHKYLLYASVKGNNGYRLNLNLCGQDIQGECLSDNYAPHYYFIQFNEYLSDIVQLYVIANDADWYVKDCRLIDLTQEFQAGNEPSTIEEYNARKPIVADEYAYNEGQVIHCNTESIKSVGDNAWDEQWEQGGLSEGDGQEYDSSSYFRSKNFIRVLPNTQYYFRKPAGVFLLPFYYDEDKNFIAADDVLFTNQEGNTFTTLNASYMRFYCNQPTYNNDIMLTLVHSGWKQDTDAGYQPYWQDTLPLPIIRKYFPDGMKKAGTAHDEIRFNKASGKWEKVVRIGSVDMGSLEWEVASNNRMIATALEDVIVRKDVANDTLLCAEYTNAYPSEVYLNTSDRIICSTNIGHIFVYDSAYTDAATFKAAIQGVILYYELAEPIVTEITEDFRDYYKVADFGTEMSQSNVPSAPFSADIIYQFNAVDMIREHELEITELQKVIATMQAQLASLTNS